MNSRLTIIVIGILIAVSILWLRLAVRGSLPNPAPTSVSDPCPDELLTKFLTGDERAIAEALDKTANTLEQAFRNPGAVCFISVTGADLISLPGDIRQLSNVRYLNLAGDKLASLPPEMGELKRLTVLSLNDNGITRLPMSLYELTRLETLALVRNKLTDVPDDIARLTNLRQLYLTGNPLTPGQVERIRRLLPRAVVDF